MLCGTGNNGGDGFLIADLAHKRGIPTTVLQLGDPRKITGDALLARQQALANGVKITPFRTSPLLRLGVIVDAMLGTGLGGEVRDEYREAIATVNGNSAPVLAVDIPSGLCADTGRVLGRAVRARPDGDLYRPQARPVHAGGGRSCRRHGIQRPRGSARDLRRRLTATVTGWSWNPCCSACRRGPPRRTRACTAPYWWWGVITAWPARWRWRRRRPCAVAPAWYKVATRAEHVAALVARTPEAMPAAVQSGQELAALVESADVLVVGPGLGQSPWSEQLLQVAAASGKPMVLDADGLNLLARGRGVAADRRDNRVLTPHPGEAARLLGTSTAAVQADRFAAVRALQQRYGGVVVLKGNGSLVTDGAQLLLSDYGNPGMASGGMGDVLSGVIGSLLAQHVPTLEAAALGVCLHGAAADRAAGDGQRGLLASDLLPHMRTLLG